MQPTSSRAKPTKANKQWRKLLASFSEQREREVDTFETAARGMRTAITTFSRHLTDLVTGQRSTDLDLEQRLGSLQNQIASGSPEEVKGAASRLLDEVRESLLRSREAIETQRRLLKSETRLIQERGCCAGISRSLDPVTHLDGSESLQEHLEFLTDLGELFAHPPVLIVLRVDQLESITADFGTVARDGVLKATADQLLRTFMGRQDFVARYDPSRLAVVLLDCSGSEAQQRASDLVSTMATHPLSVGSACFDVTLSVGLASLIPGESTSAWRERAEQALLDALAGGRHRAVLSEVPGEFLS